MIYMCRVIGGYILYHTAINYVETASVITWITLLTLNTLRPEENAWHFANDIFIYIYFTVNVCILVLISPKFVLRGPIGRWLAFVQVIALCRPGNKPILERVLTKISYYRKTPNISRMLVGNIIVDNSDVVGASPFGAAPTTSSFSNNTWLQ